MKVCSIALKIFCHVYWSFGNKCTLQVNKIISNFNILKSKLVDIKSDNHRTNLKRYDIQWKIKDWNVPVKDLPSSIDTFLLQFTIAGLLTAQLCLSVCLSVIENKKVENCCVHFLCFIRMI